MNDSSLSEPAEPLLLCKMLIAPILAETIVGKRLSLKKRKDGRNIIIKIYMRNLSAALVTKSRTVQGRERATLPLCR